MAIPIFTGSAGSLGTVNPITPPVESLQVSGYLKGTQAAQAVPSTTEAIVAGVQGAVRNYQQGVAFDQESQLNEQRIARGEREAALAPQIDAATEEQIADQRAELAQKTKLRAQQEQFNQVFENGSPQEKTDAITSGKFAELFSHNPRLENYATQVALPLMDPAEREAFTLGKSRKQMSDWESKNYQKNLAQYQQAEAEFTASPLFQQVRDNFPNETNTFKLLRDAQAQPHGKFQEQDGRILIDPTTKQPILSEDAKNGIKSTTIDVVGRDGRILARDIDRKYFDSLTKAKALSSMVGGAFEPTTAERVNSQVNQKNAAQAKAQQDIAVQQKKAQQQQNPYDRLVPPSPEVASGEKSKIPLSLPDLKKQVIRLPIAAPDGGISSDSLPQLSSIVSRSLGVDPEVASQHGEEIQDILSNIQKGIPTSTQLSAQANLASSMLASDFEENEEKYRSEYSEEAVSKYNQEVKAVQTGFREAARTGFVLGKTGIILPPTMAQIASPKDLYIEKNKQRVEQRISLAVSQVRQALNDQLQMRNSQSSIKTDILRVTSQIK